MPTLIMNKGYPDQLETYVSIAGTPSKHPKQSSHPSSPASTPISLQSPLAGSPLARHGTPPSDPSANKSEPAAADQDAASDCGTEYPESEVSLGDCLPHPDDPTFSPGSADPAAAAEQAPERPRDYQTIAEFQSQKAVELQRHARHQNFSQQDRQQDGKEASQPAEDAHFTETQYPDVEESRAEDVDQPANITSDPLWSKQDPASKELLNQAKRHATDTATATVSDHPEERAENITGTQYPDWEDDESAYPKAEAEACSPASNLQQTFNALQDGSDHQPGNSREDEMPAATQYPDIEDDDLPSPSAAQAAQIAPAPQEAPQSSHSPLQTDAEDEVPLATQYPDIEDDGPPCQDAAEIAPGLRGGPQTISRDLQADGGEDEVPNATQYPDLDEDDSLSQSQPQYHARAEPEEDIAPDAHSDFDAELDDFLAEQVFSRHSNAQNPLA